MSLLPSFASLLQRPTGTSALPPFAHVLVSPKITAPPLRVRPASSPAASCTDHALSRANACAAAHATADRAMRQRDVLGRGLVFGG